MLLEKRVKFLCAAYPNMSVSKKIKFVGGEYSTNLPEEIKLLRSMKNVKEFKPEKAPIVEVIPGPVVEELELDGVIAEEKFTVPAGWTLKKIQTFALEQGIMIPDEIELKADRIAFLEAQMNHNEE